MNTHLAHLARLDILDILGLLAVLHDEAMPLTAPYTIDPDGAPDLNTIRVTIALDTPIDIDVPVSTIDATNGQFAPTGPAMAHTDTTTIELTDDELAALTVLCDLHGWFATNGADAADMWADTADALGDVWDEAPWAGRLQHIDMPAGAWEQRATAIRTAHHHINNGDTPYAERARARARRAAHADNITTMLAGGIWSPTPDSEWDETPVG